MKVELHSFSTTVGVGGWLHSTERAPGTHWLAGWVGPRAIQDICEQKIKLCSQQEWTHNSSGIQPVVQSLQGLSYPSFYTEWEEYFVLTLSTDSGIPFWITKCTRNFARFVTWKEAIFFSSLNLSQRAHWIVICKSTQCNIRTNEIKTS